MNWGNLLTHEAAHEKGAPPRGFLCPHAGCDAAFATAAEAWAHHEGEDDVVYDPKVCLWDGCGKVCTKPAYYKAHEPVHTGVWPFSCASCGNGHSQEGATRPHRMAHAYLSGGERSRAACGGGCACALDVRLAHPP